MWRSSHIFMTPQEHNPTLINISNENNETMDADDNMVLIYNYNLNEKALPYNQHSRPSHQINDTPSSDFTISDIHYYRAILVFLLVILIYLCLALVCHQRKEEEVAEAKPEVINRSLAIKVSRRYLMRVTKV
jgi:hypothetical protein